MRQYLKVGTEISYPDSGSKNFLYFAFTVGYGTLYWIDEENYRIKQFESLSVYRVGEEKKRMVTSFEDEAKKVSDYAGLYYIRVKYEPDRAGSKLNKIGMRVYDAFVIEGAIPPHTVSSTTNEPEFPHCYLDGITKGVCFAWTLLANKGSLQAPHTINEDYTLSQPNPEIELTSRCKVIYTYRCLIGKPGFIGNIDYGQRSPMMGRGITPQEYLEMSSFERSFFFKFKNNVGTEHLITCPDNCKI